MTTRNKGENHEEWLEKTGRMAYNVSVHPLAEHTQGGSGASGEILDAIQ
jgi:hypothetical protein